MHLCLIRPQHLISQRRLGVFSRPRGGDELVCAQINLSSAYPSQAHIFRSLGSPLTSGKNLKYAQIADLAFLFGTKLLSAMSGPGEGFFFS